MQRHQGKTRPQNPRKSGTDPSSSGTAVCVLGMHRSGTSLVMRLLNIMGTYLGPEESLMPPNEDNTRGYWEHRGLVHINEAILKALGGSWDRPPESHRDWESSASNELAALRRKARAVTSETFGEASLWGWKDPRNCLTLPFWRKLIPDIRCVICLRNPLDIAASLQRRNEFPTAKCMELWFQYTTASLHNSSGLPRLFLFYEDLFDDWWGEAQRLGRFMGIQPDDTPDLRGEIQGAIESELWHNRSAVIDALDTPELAVSAKSLYFTLRTAAAAQGVSGETVIENPQFQMSLDLISKYAQVEWSRLRALQGENASLHEQLREREKALSERDVLLGEKDSALAHNSRHISQLESRLTATEDELRQTHQDFESVTGTLGYRVVERVRSGLRWLFPPGSWRRRPYQAMRRLAGGQTEPDESPGKESNEGGDRGSR